MKLVVIIAVGLRPKDLSLAPRLSALAGGGFMAPLVPAFPAVTCTAQATWLTGKTATHHGVVGNGWYFRDLAEVLFWRQSNHLMDGEKLYETAARRDPAFTCAKLFWWFNMYAPVHWSVTPRPEYHADGQKNPGFYTEPPILRDRLRARLGEFPLFEFWGPGAGIGSTRWIADSALAVIADHEPSLVLVYLPHLDYDHQRFGPDHPRSRAAVGELDAEAGRIADLARGRGYEIVVLSEYGIEPVSTPVFLNRVLHERGFLRVQETSHGQLLDAGASRAFAVADHQCAHVYVRERGDLAAVRELLRGVAGVAHVLGASEKAAWGIDHARSGELVAVSEPGSWFAYHYWLDEAARPDFATTVDIHRKPGYDPTELFFDPKLAAPRARVAWKLLRKKLGFRTLMDVVSTDPSHVRGSHGRLPGTDDSGPLWISTRVPAFETKAAPARIESTQVRDLLLGLLSA